MECLYHHAIVLQFRKATKITANSFVSRRTSTPPARYGLYMESRASRVTFYAKGLLLWSIPSGLLPFYLLLFTFYFLLFTSYDTVRNRCAPVEKG
jgi:hypothetical protein